MDERITACCFFCFPVRLSTATFGILFWPFRTANDYFNNKDRSAYAGIGTTFNQYGTPSLVTGDPSQ